MDITIITELCIATDGVHFRHDTDDVEVRHDILPASSCVSLFCEFFCFNNLI